MLRFSLILALVSFSLSAYSVEFVSCESLDLKGEVKEIFSLVDKLQQSDKLGECRTHNVQCIKFSGEQAQFVFTIAHPEKSENYRILFNLETGEFLKSDFIEKKKGLFGSDIYKLYSSGDKFTTTTTKFTLRKNKIESVKVSSRDIPILGLLDWSLMLVELFKAPNYSFKCK